MNYPTVHLAIVIETQNKAKLCFHLVPLSGIMLSAMQAVLGDATKRLNSLYERETPE